MLLAWREILPWLPALLLQVVRMGAFFVGQPMFGNYAESRLLRVVLAVALGALMFWVRPVPIAVPDLATLAVLAVREAGIGLALGFVLRLVSAGLATAGEVLSHEMGFAMSQVVDPVSGRNTLVLSQLFELIAVLLMFELDLHHDALRAFAAVQDVLPIGAPVDVDAAWNHLHVWVGDSLVFGFRYAMPVLGVMMLLTAVMVMLARAVPTLNLLEFAFGVRILLALLAAVWFLEGGRPLLTQMFDHGLDGIVRLFQP